MRRGARPRKRRGLGGSDPKTSRTRSSPSMAGSVDIPTLVAQSPAVVLAVLVWLELRAVRVTIHELGAAIAVLADRDRKP